MNEDDWWNGTDPREMLLSLGGTASDRKLRLFEVACCRRIWPLIAEEAYRNIAESAERYADGKVGWDELLEAEKLAYHRSGSQGEVSALWAASLTAGDCIETTPYHHDEDVSHTHAALAAAQAGTTFEAAHHAERLAQCHLIRDIFGNPFRPVTIDPARLSSNVVALAQTIYEDRAFERMPVLSDALEEAGCHDADILVHCRQAGSHVRGCWVVDAVLGRS
jgi:hypothetical protein